MRSKNRVFLNDAAVRKLMPPASGYEITYDIQIPGYGVRTTASGIKAFVLRYRTRGGGGRELTHTIGRYPAWSAVAARTKAKELRRAIDDGADPAGALEERRVAPTVNDLADRFVKEHLPRLRPGSARNYRVLLAKHVLPALGRMKVADVRYSDVDRMHQRITADGNPFAANRATTVFAVMCALAIRWGMRTDNPVKGIQRNPEPPRRRYLAGDELPRLLAALADHPTNKWPTLSACCC